MKSNNFLFYSGLEKSHPELPLNSIVDFDFTRLLIENHNTFITGESCGQFYFYYNSSAFVS